MKRQNLNNRGEKEDGFAKQPRRLSSEVAVKMAQRPASPAPSCLSMKSNASMDCAYVFSQGDKSNRKRVEIERPGSSSANYVLGESGRTVEINWDEKVERQDLPGPSSLPMKSNASMDCAYVFSRKGQSSKKRVEVKRLVSPCPSHDFEDRDLREEINQDEIMSGEKFKGLHPSPTTKEMYTSAKLTRCREESLCLQHCAPLDVFCKTDQTLICKQCATLEHQDHNKCYTTGAKFSQELDTVSLLEQTLNKVDKNKFMSYLCQNYPECFETPQVICDIHEVSKVILERFGSEVALKIAIKVLLENETVAGRQDLKKSNSCWYQPHR
ncbi:NACHT, LRR and PYD domains-containing protein 3-like isoform X1 [Tachysurus ichikawai]